MSTRGKKKKKKTATQVSTKECEPFKILVINKVENNFFAPNI